MKLVEIRDLDGPNLFLPVPAIKIEFEGDSSASPRLTGEIEARLRGIGVFSDDESTDDASLGDALIEAVEIIYQRSGFRAPETAWRKLETPGHWVLAFEWRRRAFALAVAERIVAAVAGPPTDTDQANGDLTRLLTDPPLEDDVPGWVRDEDRTIPVVGITGTNGKTTTTRLLAHVLREAGRSVGWSSTSGVYINGELVLEGDYTGPSGARRVLKEPGLDVAVLETARGGILLRGLAYESNDVSVFTNVSADHLDMLGVRSIEGLLAVKATVVRATRRGGVAVLNADDPLVRSLAPEIHATPMFVSRDPSNPTVVNHVAAGGKAIVVRDGVMTLIHGQAAVAITNVANIPMSYGGRAAHMVENALCAAGAAIALGLTIPEIAAGMASFRNTPALNPGRLHIYETNGTTVVLDYAHNEAGLKHLLTFGRSFVRKGGKLVSVIGTAGDRSDEALRSIGEIAAESSDYVVIKETIKYLRGRENAAGMTALMAEGVGRVPGVPWGRAPTELSGVELALEGRRPGDTVVVMCIEQPDDVRAMLESIGTLVS